MELAPADGDTIEQVAVYLGDNAIKFGRDAGTVREDTKTDDFDGHTVAERLRTNPKNMFIPVVFLTARTSPADRQRAYENGAYAYITKPFKPEKLLDALQRAPDRDA